MSMGGAGAGFGVMLNTQGPCVLPSSLSISSIHARFRSTSGQSSKGLKSQSSRLRASTVQTLRAGSLTWGVFFFIAIPGTGMPSGAFHAPPGTRIFPRDAEGLAGQMVRFPFQEFGLPGECHDCHECHKGSYEYQFSTDVCRCKSSHFSPMGGRIPGSLPMASFRF